MNRMLDLTQTVLERTGTYFLVTDASFKVVASSKRAWAGRLLDEVVPALRGMEEALRSVAAQTSPPMHLPYLSLEGADFAASFFSLYIVPYRPTDGLLVIIREDTESALLMQRLSQQHNDLALLQEKLEQYARDLEAANEQLRALNQERSFLISMISHDIRTPLATIQNALALFLIEAKSLSEEQRNVIEMALDATKSARELADLILQIERTHQGAESLHAEKVNPVALVREVVNRYRGLAVRKGLDLALVLRDVPPILGDWALLREALSNIMDNAIKYNEPGGRVVVRLSEDDGGVKLEVEDTGMGMAAEEIPALFKPFRRGRTTDHRPGTGLGLYIAHKIVSIHQGRMWVDSQPGEGSHVFIWLPIAEVTNPEEAG